MSFLVKRPNLPQTTNAAQANQIPSFQGAVPMTLAYGRVPFQGARWLCDAFGRHTQTAGSNKPDWQYANIAASFGSGTASFVGKVRYNGQEIANLAHDRVPGEDYIDYTFNPSLASGEAFWMRFYFGTETQTADTFLRTGTGQNHPAYRGQPYAVFHNLDLGQGTTAIPQIEIEVGFATPAVGSYAAPSGAGAHPYGINPFAAIYGLLTTPYGGLAADASLLDATHWGNQAAALESTGIAQRTGDLTHLHAVLSSFTDVASAISEWLTYVDGYIYARGGKLKVGWFPHASTDPSSLPQITEHDLVSKPSGGGFPDANADLTDTVVTYLDFARQYTQQGAKYRAPANRRSQIAKTPQQVDRPGCHASDQALYLASEASTSGTQQDTGTTLQVLRSIAVNLDGSPLMPGDLFNYVYDPEALEVVLRVIERIETDPAAPVQLTVVRDRGAFPTPFTPALDPRVLPTDDDPGEVTAPDVRLWMLPSGFGPLRQVTALIDRHTRADAGALLYLSTAGSAPWQQINDQRYFPAKCAVGGAGINNSATTVRVTSTSIDFARFQAQNSVAQLDDTLLLLIEDEVVSVSTISVVATNTYDLGIIRGREGTAAAAHAAGVVAWLFYRSELQAVENEEFYRVRNGGNVYDATIATKYFKIALFTAVPVVGAAKPNDPGLSLQLPDLSADETKGYSVILTNEAHTVSTDNAGNVNAGQLGAGGTAKTTVKVYRGSTLLTVVAAGPNSDQYSIALGTVTNTTATKEANDRVRCDTLTADTGTIEISVNVAGAFTITKVFTLSKSYKGDAGTNGTNGTNGVRGSKSFYAATSGSSWSNTDADAAITGAGFTKVALDTVTLYNTSAGYSETKYWDGAAWQPVTQVIDGNLIVHGTVGADKISVTTLAAINANLGTVTAGSITASASVAVGSGITKTNISSSGPVFGDTGAGNTNVAVLNSGSVDGLYLRSGTTVKAYLGYNPSSGIAELYLNTNGVITVGTVNAQILKAFSTSDPRTTDAPLYTAGGGWIEKTLDVRGRLYCNSHVDVAGTLSVPGAVGSSGGIKYNNGATNFIAFYWDGSNVHVIVDGSQQGTIPNP